MGLKELDLDQNQHPQDLNGLYLTTGLVTATMTLLGFGVTLCFLGGGFCLSVSGHTFP